MRADLGTVEVLTPSTVPGFSFTIPLRAHHVRLHWSGSGRSARPLDRSDAGFHHLGDLTLRVRELGIDGALSVGGTGTDSPPSPPYRKYSTVSTMAHPADSGADGGLIPARDGASAWMDMSTQLRPRGLGLRLVREISSRGAEARITWTLTNRAARDLEIGGLGASMPFNQLFTGRRLADVAANCSFIDAYVGKDAGYLQVAMGVCL